jgi:hypothetical protein
MSYNKKEEEKDNTGFGVYLNHEGVKFGYGLGGGIHVDDDGFHFGGLKL